MSDPATPLAPSIFTHEQAILIAARLVVAYLLFWVIDDLTILPREVLAVAHYMKTTGSVLGTNNSMPLSSYELRLYILDLFGNFLRMALWLMIAGWFYRCGPRIRNFFASENPPVA